MKVVKFIINKDGSFTAEAQNYKGTSCETDINRILQESGAKTEYSANKPEYYEQEVVNEDYGHL